MPGKLVRGMREVKRYGKMDVRRNKGPGEVVRTRVIS